MVADTSAARLEGTWARHAVAHVEALRSIDPSWGSTWYEVADGIAMLQGPGLYVNRALALGLLRPVAPAILDALERASATIGVAPSVDVVPATDVDLVAALAARGYAPSSRVSVMTRPIDEPVVDAEPSIVIHPISPHELPLWQEVSVAAWEHTTASARRAGDVYAAAAHAIGEHLMLAADAESGRPLGCASLIVREGLASLGGMSTLPAERGRGVQRALVAERLRSAAAAGCDLAAVSAVVGGASERNLLRLGFQHRYVKTTWTRA
jgi:GNAT superfamily N-acetyltransferase